jgi:hypothetical protein
MIACFLTNREIRNNLDGQVFQVPPPIKWRTVGSG